MEHLIRMEKITKRFPGVVALKDVDFELLPGEVHVLLGENGAGKSTLMKILSGAYEPTEGTIHIRGESFQKLTPALSAEKGISIIYQELSLVQELSIAENLFLGKLPGKGGMVDHSAMYRKTEELLQQVDLKRSPNVLVKDLSISEKQMVEIAKSLAFNADVIVMDEPTSSLTETETEKLFTIIRRLRKEGKGIVYISHKLRELSEIGDRVTVLKDGTYVGTRNIADTSIDMMISMMVGRELADKYQGSAKVSHHDKVILEVENLTRKDKRAQDISFKLYEGEILGFSGLIGSGRSETMEAIYGVSPIKSGKVTLLGKQLHIRNTCEALKEGIGLVTENRRETGFFHNFSILRNMNIAKQLKRAKLQGTAALIDPADERKTAKEEQANFQVKCASLDQLITQLSGGNQQKVILGKWHAADVKLLIFDEPTKGIDVGTKAEIYRLMREMADRGVGVIVISSDMPELLAVSDRILVMKDGRINGSFDIDDATEEKLLKAATIEA